MSGIKPIASDGETSSLSSVTPSDAESSPPVVVSGIKPIASDVEASSLSPVPPFDAVSSPPVVVSGIKPIASDVEASSLSSFSSSISSPFSPSWSKGEFMLDWAKTSCESRFRLSTVGVSNSTSLISVCAVSTSTEFSRCIDCEICQSARRSATSLISIPSNLIQISPR